MYLNGIIPFNISVVFMSSIIIPVLFTYRVVYNDSGAYAFDCSLFIITLVLMYWIVYYHRDIYVFDCLSE